MPLVLSQNLPPSLPALGLMFYVYLVRSLVQVAANAFEAREYVGYAEDVEWRRRQRVHAAAMPRRDC